MAATFSKVTLSNSTSGKQILVAGTTSGSATLIHNAFAGISGSNGITADEIWLYASNNSTSSLTCSILWGGTTEPNDVIRFILPPQNSRTLLCDGKLLQNGLNVQAYGQVANTIVIDGFVNRIADGSIDSAVTSWAQRVVNNGGSAPSAGTQVALTGLYRGIVNAGIMKKMVAVWPFPPDNLMACQTPLFYQYGFETASAFAFTASNDLTVNGLKGNGTSAYMRTNIIPGSIQAPFGVANAGMTAYMSGFQAGQAGGYTAGVGGLANSSHFALFLSDVGGTKSDAFIWRFINVGQDFLQPNKPSGSAGYFSINRTSNSQLDFYFGNSTSSHVNLATSTGAQTGVIISDQDLYLFALNGAGAVTGFTNITMSFFALHQGLTAQESQNFFNTIQQYRMNIGGGYG